MNEETAKQIVDLILSAKDFAMAQVPSVVKQFMIREIVFNSVLLLIGILLFLAGLKLYRKIKDRKNELDDDALATLLCIFSFVSSLALLIASGCVLFSIIVAPKVFILEWLSMLATGGQC